MEDLGEGWGERVEDLRGGRERKICGDGEGGGGKRERKIWGERERSVGRMGGGEGGEREKSGEWRRKRKDCVVDKFASVITKSSGLKVKVLRDNTFHVDTIQS